MSSQEAREHRHHHANPRKDVAQAAHHHSPLVQLRGPCVHHYPDANRGEDN